MNAISTYDKSQTDALRGIIANTHARIAQLHLPTKERSTTARNYDSSIRALGAYLTANGHDLPTRGALEQWRDDMAGGRVLSARGKPYAVRSINAKLSAARKLLESVAADVTDITTKFALRDWATVSDSKETVEQDKTETDYGKRLALQSLTALINSPDTTNIKGLRDRALLAVCAGAGLRISEAKALTVADVFHTQNESGQRGIRVLKGKHNKSRIVVMQDWNSWVIEAVAAYTDALGITMQVGAVIFRGVKRVKGGGYDSTDKPLSVRKLQDAVERYPADYLGEAVQIAAHDLRRTYAKLCKQAGMSWEALRANMGHSSVVITENYVGKNVDWSERVPNWSVKLNTI